MTLTIFESFFAPLAHANFLTSTLQVLTHLGDARVISVVVVSMAIILIRHAHFDYAVGLAVTMCGAVSTSLILKLLIERPRPLQPLIEVSGYSFPSLHATCAFALYGFLMYMTWRLMHPPHHRAPWAMILAALILLIGYSRIALGVHFASDVLGGFGIAALWLCIGVSVQRKIAATPRREQ